MKLQEQIDLLKGQVDYFKEQLTEALLSKNLLTVTIQNLQAIVEEQRKQIASLEDALKGKVVELDKEKTAREAIRRLQGSPSERQSKPATSTDQTPDQEQQNPAVEPPAKKRGNNGAKRKTHPECEIEIVIVEPDSPDFDPNKARLISECDVIRYVVVPMKFKKIIYKERTYALPNDVILRGKAPLAPLQNSQYTSSFIAGLAELRYLHGLPLESAVQYFRSHGFDLDKGTARKLVSKVKVQLENLYKALASAILQDSYICGDETYQKVRLPITEGSDKTIKKGYIWVFVGMTTGLVYFFYDDGSRKAEVFEAHIKGFKGYFQCDYYSGYRRIGIGDMKDIYRIPCLQHIKRKFLDIKTSPQAQEIARLFGLLYHHEHQHKIGQDDWTPEEHLKWRQKYSKVVLEEIYTRLMAVKNRPGVPPDDPLLGAAEHALKQWKEIPRIFESPFLCLDSNAVERINRYISLTRRRLTIGSHAGAGVAVVYHSLTASCRKHGLNVFEYLCDIIDRCCAWPPNTPIEKYRDLLPDRWVKKN